MEPRWHFDCFQHDILAAPVPGSFDGAYSLDVLEHIPSGQEHRFMENVVNSLTEHGRLVIGMPSLESQHHASAASRMGHVNCKTEQGLSDLVSRYFHHVFLFSMNDEVVHTGFGPLAHYRLALCCGKKDAAS
jgi:cyclopropane fatty-acyl-phospholipid synthase-like methyltransferase